jgi:hypothetical protein
VLCSLPPTEDELFSNILTDLEELANKGDDYSMLRAAALLRQLLLDSPALIHKVTDD